jgi:hypothetical protein
LADAISDAGLDLDLGIKDLRDQKIWKEHGYDDANFPLINNFPREKVRHLVWDEEKGKCAGFEGPGRNE